MSDIAEDAWLAEQRAIAIGYLQKEGISTPVVAEVPAFHVSPYVSLWAVRSKKNPDAVGWWVIAGDLPTDYLSAENAEEPRMALAAIARLWKEAAERMLRGERDPDFKVGRSEDWPTLGDLLLRRSGILMRYSEDETLWEKAG
jgi:hypothetical protein